MVSLHLENKSCDDDGVDREHGLGGGGVGRGGIRDEGFGEGVTGGGSATRMGRWWWLRVVAE